MVRKTQVDSSNDRLVTSGTRICDVPKVLQLYEYYTNLLIRWLESIHGGILISVSSGTELCCNRRGMPCSCKCLIQDQELHPGLL